MDNCTRDNSPRPDPPGSSDFVFRYIDDNHDGGMESISTLTDPPPIQSPLDVPNILTNSPPIKSLLEKQCVSSSFTPNSPTWTIAYYKQNTKMAMMVLPSQLLLIFYSQFMACVVIWAATEPYIILLVLHPCPLPGT
jgi:hypothetical protein